MNRNNRWVRLSEVMPWDEMIRINAKSMGDFGSPTIDARIANGAMIIKTKLGLSDEDSRTDTREYVYAVLGA